MSSQSFGQACTAQARLAAPTSVERGHNSDSNSDAQQLYPSSFLSSGVIVVGCGVVGSLSSFALSLVAVPFPNGSTPSPKSRAAYIGFDLLMWLTVAGIFLSHFQTSFPIALHHKYSGLAFAFSMVVVFATHSVLFLFPNSPDVERLNDFCCFFMFNVVGICALKLAKKALLRDLHSRSAQQNLSYLNAINRTSLIFRLLVAAMIAYGCALVVTDPLIAAASIAITLFLGTFAGVVAMKHRKRRRRSFDFGVLMWTAYHVGPLSRRIVTTLNKAMGKGYTLLLVLGYRTTLATCGFILDDLMDAAFGEWTLWPAFYLRITEALVSITLAFNDSPNGIIGYLASNLLVSMIKDSGILDDCRFALRNGFSVLSPIGSIEASGEAAMLTRVLPGQAMVSGTGATSLSTSRREQRRRACWLQIIGRFSRRIRTVHVSRLHLDLRLQIERSETTFLSRLTALCCVASVYIMALLVGRSAPDRIELHPVPSQATWLLGLSLVEVALSRSAAIGIMKWKIRRFDHIKAKVDRCMAINKVKSSLSHSSFSSMPQSFSCSSFGVLMSAGLDGQASPTGASRTADSSLLATNLAPVSITANDSANKSPVTAPASLVPLAQWSTELPWRKNRPMAFLVLLTVIYSAATQYGPW